MVIRRRTILTLAALAAVGLGVHYIWLKKNWNGLPSPGEADSSLLQAATRSQTYVLAKQPWLEFLLPSGISAVRVVTNAALTEMPDAPSWPEDPRPGCRYAIDYQILDRRHECLHQDTYHFRSRVAKYVDSATGRETSRAFYPDTEFIAAGTRTMQYPLDSFVGKPQLLRVRLLEADTGIAEVTVRAYGRHQRPDYDQPYAWKRISRPRRETLCRANVYPPSLLTARERLNLLRWQWSPLSPNGIEGVDYLRRVLYTRVDGFGEETGPLVLPDGLLVQHDLRGVIPLPNKDGLVHFEFERADRWVQPDRTAELEIWWYGKGIHRRGRHRCVLDESVQTLKMPMQGGLAVIDSQRDVVVRAKWRPASEAADAAWEDITPEPTYLRAYQTDPEHAVTYTVSHLDPFATPLRVTLRRLSPAHEGGRLAPRDGPNHAERDGGFGYDTTPRGGHVVANPIDVAATAKTEPSGPISVHWELLDAAEQTVSEGTVVIDGSPSVYDQARGQLNACVSDPTTYFFAVPGGVRQMRLASCGGIVLVSAYSRPPDIGNVTRVPEDYYAFHRGETANRTWFMLRPDNHPGLLEQNRCVSILVQSRPPEDDPDLAAGRYEWEDFRPEGLWTARHLLTPSAPGAPIRVESVRTAFLQLEIGRDCQIQLLPGPNQSWIEPSVVYESESPQTRRLQLFLDGQLYHEADLRSSRGELMLPRLPADQWTGRKRIRIEADGPARVFLSSAVAAGRPAYRKRLALRLGKVPLRFDYDKTEPGQESLTLHVYRSGNTADRTRVRVSIEASRTREPGPHSSWTIIKRTFDLGPSSGQPTIVLGAESHRADEGHKCLIPLGEDLSPGRYVVQIIYEGADDAYAVLSKTTPGLLPRRDLFLERYVDSTHHHTMKDGLPREEHHDRAQDR